MQNSSVGPHPTAPRSAGALAAVALGGALGAPARYGIAALVDITPGTFPWGTFWINVSGSLALGFLMAVFSGRYPHRRGARLFLTTGLLGAYTTYSTLAVEADLLANNGYVGIALRYTALSVIAGLAAAWTGLHAGRTLVTHRPAPSGSGDLTAGPRP